MGVDKSTIRLFRLICKELLLINIEKTYKTQVVYTLTKVRNYSERFVELQKNRIF